MSNVRSYIEIIDRAFVRRAGITPDKVDSAICDAVYYAIEQLNSGQVRIAEKKQDQWIVNEWLKKAVLLYFRINENQWIEAGFTRYWDKVPLKYAKHKTNDFTKDQVRIVPPAVARYGSYVAPQVVMMPAYINIGAYVGSGTMVDTWATVGSCAQIGKNVHLSGGVGIGGVLEPVQAAPTIIEDHCFIGARSEIVEGVIVGEGSVISMGVYIGQSTRIYNRETGKISYGFIPPGSVVVAGSLPDKNAQYSLYCAVIVKQVDKKTRSKVGINELLRDI